MSSQAVINFVFLLLLLVGSYILAKHNRQTRVAPLSQYLKNTDLSSHAKCASVIDQLRLAMARLETKDAALLNALTDAVTGQMRSQRVANLQNVCTSCDAGGCSPEAMDWVAANCVDGQYRDPGQIVPVQVTVPGAVPTPPSFVRFTASDWFGRSNCSFTVRWSALDAGVRPVLRVTRPNGTDVVIDSLTPLQREFTFVTPVITEATEYKVTLGAKNSFSGAPQDVVWDTANTKAVSMSPSTADVPPVARVEQNFTHVSVRFVWVQPPTGKELVLQLSQSKVMDESAPIAIPVPNTTPGAVVDYDLTPLTPFTWYTYRFGVRFGPGSSVTWSDPAAFRTKPEPNPGIPLTQTGKTITSLTLQWNSIPGNYQARFYFQKGAILSVAGPGSVVGSSTSFSPPEALEMGTTYVGVLRIRRTWLDAGIPETLPALRTYTVESESIVWATTETPPTIPYSAVTFQVTDRTYSVTWNTTIPTGYRPIVIFSQGADLPVPANQASVPYSSVYDSSVSRENTTMVVEDAWWEAYNLEPNTVYTAALALTDGNLILLFSMPKQTLRTFSATESQYPIIQSVTPSSTTNSSSMRVRWYTSTMTDAVKSKLDIGLIRVFPNPSQTASASVNNTASMSLEKSELIGQAASSTEPAGYTSAVMNVTPYPGMKYTFTMMYYFTDRTPTTSAPRSQNAQYWKLAMPSPNLGLAVTNMVRAAGTASDVLVTLGWVNPTLPLPAEVGPLTYGRAQLNDNTPVSILNRDPATQALQSILSTTTFTVQPNTVNTFRVEFANNRGADKLTGVLTNVSVPPIPALPTVTAYPMSYSIAYGVSTGSGATLGTGSTVVLMPTNSSGVSDRLTLLKADGTALVFATTSRSVLTGLTPGAAYTVKERSETDTTVSTARLVSEATVTATTLAPVQLTAAPALVSMQVFDASTASTSSLASSSTVLSRAVDVSVSWAAALPTGVVAADYSASLEVTNVTLNRTFTFPVSGTQLTLTKADPGCYWRAKVVAKRKVVLGGVTVEDTSGTDSPVLGFASFFQDSLNVRQTGATTTSATIAWDAASVPTGFVVRLQLVFSAASYIKILTAEETAAGSIVLSPSNTVVSNLAVGATAFVGQFELKAGRFAATDLEVGHWESETYLGGVLYTLSVEDFTLTTDATDLSKLTVSVPVSKVAANLTPWARIEGVDRMMTKSGSSWQLEQTGLKPSFTAVTQGISSSPSTYEVKIGLGFSAVAPSISVMSAAKQITMRSVSEPPNMPEVKYYFSCNFVKCASTPTRFRFFVTSPPAVFGWSPSVSFSYTGLNLSVSDLCNATSTTESMTITQPNTTQFALVDCSPGTAAATSPVFSKIDFSVTWKNVTYPALMYQKLSGSALIPTKAYMMPNWQNVLTTQTVEPYFKPGIALKWSTQSHLVSSPLTATNRFRHYYGDNNVAGGAIGVANYTSLGTFEYISGAPANAIIQLLQPTGLIDVFMDSNKARLDQSGLDQLPSSMRYFSEYQFSATTGTRIRISFYNMHKRFQDLKSETVFYEGTLGADGFWSGGVTSRPSIAPENFTTDGSLSHESSSQFCQSIGMQLCRRNDICTYGWPDQTNNMQTVPGNMWVPTRDDSNTWVSIGEEDYNRLCKTHQTATGSKPTWGTTSTIHPFRTQLPCCPILATASPAAPVQPATQTTTTTTTGPETFTTDGTLSYNQSVQYCTARGKRLCATSDICSNGQPVMGMQSQDTWLPTRDEDNNWVSVGNVDPANRLCKSHQASLGVKPSWGTNSTMYGFRTKVTCCPNA